MQGRYVPEMIIAMVLGEVRDVISSIWHSLVGPVLDQDLSSSVDL